MLYKHNLIAAYCIVSESEIAYVEPTYSYEWWNTSNENYEKLIGLLWQFGMNIDYPIEYQACTLHRNRMNNVVQCCRYVGQERTDDEWLSSGYASQEVTDKVKGSKLLEDQYRRKGLTIDAQIAMEYRDFYAKPKAERKSDDQSNY